MVITHSLLQEVDALERQHAVLVATIDASRSLDLYHVFGAPAESQLLDVELQLNHLLFAMLAVTTPMEVN